MVDVKDVGDVARLIQAVADAVLATASAPLSGERGPEWCTDSIRVLSQGPEHELDAGCGDCLWQVLAELPCGGSGHDDPEAHSAPRAFDSIARMAFSSRTFPSAMSFSELATRSCASGSLSSSMVASIDSRSSAASSTT